MNRFAVVLQVVDLKTNESKWELRKDPRIRHGFAKEAGTGAKPHRMIMFELHVVLSFFVLEGASTPRGRGKQESFEDEGVDM